MRITRIETFQIETPRYYGYVSGHAIIKISTDEGLIGLGEASDSRAKDLAAVAAQYNELLVGHDATGITEIYELLRRHRFNSSVSDMHLTSAIDIALWDLNGKALGVLDNRFLTEMKTRFGDRLKLKSIDLSHRFKDWESGVRYADALRHHDPFHFEGPSHSMHGSMPNLPGEWTCR